MTEYEKIYAFGNLYRAYRKSSQGKHGKKEVIAFELKLSENLWRLHDLLKTRKYRIPGYRHFMIHDPKEREIQALSFEDRVVQSSLCENILKPWFEKRLIYDCAACREGKGTHFAIRRLTGFLQEFYREHGTDGYFLKCDIRKYFNSIDHDELKYLLRNYPDPEVKVFLYMIIDSFQTEPGKGLPMGNQSSQWFALYHLDRMDRIIKEKYQIRFYTRYMDDLVLLHEDKDHLKACLSELNAAADELKLKFNEKTQLFPVSEGVDYLGWHFYLTENGKVIRRLRTSGKRRLKRRLRSFQERYRNGGITLEEISRSMASYSGHLDHGHTWKLRNRLLSRFILTHASKEKRPSDSVKLPVDNVFQNKKEEDSKDHETVLEKTSLVSGSLMPCGSPWSADSPGSRNGESHAGGR